MIIRYVYFSFVSIALLGTFFAGALFFFINHHVIDFSILSHYRTYPSVLIDDEGNEWGRFQLDKKDPIDDSDLPTHVINAFIAAEDWDFFKHAGISYKVLFVL